ncbi:MAG: Sir2 family NAD-dependent protein deacetylase [Verrucomicrobiota bacterium]
MNAAISRAAKIIGEAEAILVTAGAGMGVDSGLPDFRGNEGFWKAYPPYRKLGRSFVEMANPDAFASDPTFAWGFYGHRLELYRKTPPHCGFDRLLNWGRSKPGGIAVMTSNVDGHFQAAGFDEALLYEVHGSIHHLQCITSCRERIWPAGNLDLRVDLETMRAEGTLPRCPDCDAIARPNILMFGDWNYEGTRNGQQRQRVERWIDSRKSQVLVILEFGAGTAVPTVRHFSESVSHLGPDIHLIRINPREPQVPRPQDLAFPMGALEAIESIAATGIADNGYLS